MTLAARPRPGARHRDDPVRRVPRHRRLPGVDPRTARLTFESGLLGLVAGVIVVAPWTREGYLLLLDWVAGPHQAITPGLYGLDPAALDALPYRLVTHAVRRVVGAGATSWLVILCYFPVAASGVSALAGGGRWRRHSAALFACCNPFVVERIQAGHVAFLLSVALLSWLLASAVRARRRDRWFAARPAGWYAMAMAVGPHAAWLGGAGLLAVALLPRPRLKDLGRTAVVIAAAGCIYAYALAVVLSAILTVRVGGSDLEVYAPHAGPGGMFATLVSLRGFWRGGADSSPQVGLGLVPAAVMLAAALAGLARLCRREPVTGLPLAVLAVAGLLLGAGIHGPLAGAYRAAFDVVPLFVAMREQQKWVALTMLAYAVGIGVTVELLAAACRAARPAGIRLTAAGALVAVAGVYAVLAPSLAWGLGGSVKVSQYPESWYAADDIMGAGSEAVLFLPWHEYQPFGFTGSRTVATPAGAFFRRPVLASDAVELGPVRTNSVSRRTAYVQRLVAAGGAGGFGRLIAPLGVRYVVLARDREAEEYDWLAAQKDLRRVLRTRQLDVYRVEASGTGRVVASRAGGYDDAVALAARGALGSEAMLEDGPATGRPPSAASGGAHRRSSTSWQVAPGTPGWVVIPEEWSPGWRAGELPTRRTVAGTVAVEAGPGAVTVRYEPWRALRLGLLASLVSLVVLLVAGLVEHRRDLSRWWAAPGPPHEPRVRRPRRAATARRRERRPGPAPGGTDGSGAAGRR
ncbi:hypothetical protein [Pseudosporangium ferrugineum]|uniref:Membrane protein YfhO n=1 Tax=Pseudosporangium ferrugineum TaxID=439699 RepID=A0A2T0SFJ3_9ACTN|nr:hypothetical protein [Pseudosporangium ferrugineum]PRY32187.1 hypothetical protein CLV70_102398 [Pseudosporangium ferrugineum]